MFCGTMNIRKEGDKMAYTIDKQETHIWYDPKSKETIVETNYVHDINHYLRIIADGGMELLDHEVEGAVWSAYVLKY